MASKGYISLHRKIMENWLWEDKPFSKGQAWIDLLLLANHSEHEKPYKGQMKKYAPGTVNLSIQFLADRWGWSWRRVRRFINLLENAKMVTTDVTTNDTTITIVNWDLYQHTGRTNGTTICTNEGQSEGQGEGHINNNDNNDKEWGEGAPPRPREDDYSTISAEEALERMKRLTQR